MINFERELTSLLPHAPHERASASEIDTLELELGQPIPKRLREFLRLAGNSPWSLLGHFCISCAGMRDVQLPFRQAVSNGIAIAPEQNDCTDMDLIQPRFALCQDVSDVFLYLSRSGDFDDPPVILLCNEGYSVLGADRLSIFLLNTIHWCNVNTDPFSENASPYGPCVGAENTTNHAMNRRSP